MDDLNPGRPKAYETREEWGARIDAIIEFAADPEIRREVGQGADLILVRNALKDAETEPLAARWALQFMARFTGEGNEERAPHLTTFFRSLTPEYLERLKRMAKSGEN